MIPLEKMDEATRFAVEGKKTNQIGLLPDSTTRGDALTGGCHQGTSKLSRGPVPAQAPGPSWRETVVRS